MPARIRFRAHALRRMFERSISVDDVEAVLQAGEVIESYPDDQPNRQAAALVLLVRKFPDMLERLEKLAAG